MGGVAPMPWRVPDAEASLIGRTPSFEAFRDAAEIAMRGAQPLSQNAFKVDLGKHSIVRALTLASNGPQTK